MKKSFSRVVGVAIGAAMTLGMVSPAFAATIPNVQFTNGQTQISCTAGSSVNTTFRVVVPAGEVAEIGQSDVVGDSLAPSLPITLGGDLGLQEGAHDVTVNVTCPQNTGYYTVEFRTAGIFGGQRAVVVTDGVTSVASFSNALRVVSGSTSTGGGTTTPAPGSLEAQIAALIAMIKLLTEGQLGGAPSALCTQYKNFSYLHFGMSGAAGLQSFLINNGQASILTYGATGYYGMQTQNAAIAFVGANNCK